MRVLGLFLLAAGALQAVPFHLRPGEYRWLPFSVQRIPTAVDCSFRVLEGGPTVHMEVMTLGEFRRFNRKRDYDTLASAPDGREGEIRRLLDERGQFAVVVMNGAAAPVATVDLEVRTDLDPSADSMAQTLPPGRRLAVILISFGLFFAMVMGAGWRLWRGVNAGGGLLRR
jgi:hypothetical protein